MAGTKAMIHLVIAPNEIPSNAVNQRCAAIDVYENGDKVMGSSIVNYDDLTSIEQQLWDDFVTMITSKEV